MNNSLKIYFTLICVWFAIASHAQTIRVIDNKGTIRSLESSKWSQTGTSISNKNSPGFVGINTNTPTNFLEVSGTASSSVSGLRLTGLGTVTPAASVSNVLAVNNNGDIIVTQNVAANNWLITGNSNALSTSFLGTTNDVKMSIRSNNVPTIEFGRRQTLGLVQSFTDYTDGNQVMTYLRGNGGTSSLQFQADNSAFYKPQFFTTPDGNFRLKGSAARTDFFEMGSSGTINNGSFEILVGDDGEEPIIFKKFNFDTATQIEMMRLQGTGLNNTVRVGINTGAVANSTLELKGSISLPIRSTTGNGDVNLTELDYTLIITGNNTITLPAANTCTGRIYRLKNVSGGNRTITNSYISTTNTNTNSLLNNTTYTLQSDGSVWQALVNNNNVTTATTAPTSPVVGDVWFDNSNPAQVLTKIWNGTSWVIDSIKGTAGSVFFAGANSFPTEKNAELFWDNTNNRLGIGLSNPEESLHIKNNMRLTGSFGDKDGDKGLAGQVLSSTATGTDWVNYPYAVVQSKTTSYTLVATDNGSVITMNNTGAITLTIPAGLPIGFNLSVYQTGTGTITISGAAGVTIKNRLNRFKTAGTDAGIGITSTDTNIFHITGDLKR